jgi:4'-phosphopantetheinyl transferase
VGPPDLFGHVRWMANGECDLPSSDGWLSEREVAHVAAIRFTKRRREYLTRRWTAKRAVAAVLGLDDEPTSLATVEIRNRESGAPYVEVDREPAGLDVSISDRAGWAVCLVGPPGSASAGSLGIDLEVVEPRTDRFINDFFTAAECDYVLGLPAGEPRDEAANLIWSAKEAALKLQQVGLRADTRTVEVTIERTVRPDGWAAMVITAARGQRMPGWWRRDGVFLSTIAFAANHPPPGLIAGGADLACAVPLHSWVDQPVV